MNATEDRKDKIDQLLTLHFEDEADYTRLELEDMDDDELNDCYDAEFNISAPEAELELEQCVVCKQMKVCPFMDDQNQMPVCQTCADDANDDTELVTAADEQVDEGDDDDEEDEDEDSDDEDDDDLDDLDDEEESD